MAKGKEKLDKGQRKALRAARKQRSRERRSQLWQAFKIQREQDKWLIPIMVGAIVGTTLLLFGFGWLLSAQWLFLPMGLILGFLLAFMLFGRRVTKTVYKKAEGQTGAAAWALDSLRGPWKVTNAVAGTTHLDAVHRVLGRPGVILVGEGAPHRVKGLLAQEKKRVSRLVGNTPIYEIVVGNGDDQIPLPKLQKAMNRLPKNITRKQMDALDSRLAAIASRTSGPAMPKGPVPGGGKMKSVQRSIRRR
ncbi:DUF4191 domain-containing protein [Hoyosella rhizosphaerae]|uniref:Membrane protein n=1 Tax=Hoyosella rhizosphaerae TaxID=1755582 RepID=A0A916UGK8_9ACTN|nr:DUF4191 domain-containing protein [Hoyosella rhizosphaerae]MBN4927977.1 DUF4191 domain-containing protein [Hoyosella rhizosphaerae]GGC71387.1 membrane protein [Hoyosella rhizosphaerae]